MGNFITSLILIIIAFFVLNLFPFFRDWTTDIKDGFNEKKGNVVSEYDRVKGEIDDVTDKVTSAKEKVENTLDNVGKVIDSTGAVIETVDNAFRGEEEATEEEATEEGSAEEVTPDDSASAETGQK